MGASLACALAALAFQATAAYGAMAKAAAVGHEFEVLRGSVAVEDAVLRKGMAVRGTERNVRPASGARITLSFLDLQDAKVGEAVQPTVLASAVADSAGRYALDLKPSPRLLARLKANGNFLNLDLGVLGGGQVDTQAVSVYWNGKGWGHPHREAQTRGRSYTTRLARDASTGETSGGTVEREARESSTTAIVSVACSFIVTGKPTRYTKVVEFHNSTATSGSWRYGQSADSDVDAGINMSGTGGWKISGTSHVGTSNGAYSGADASGVLKGYYGTTNMEYTEGYYKAASAYNSTTYCSGLSVKPNTKSLKATKWLAGTSSTGDLTQYDCYDSPQSSYRNQQIAGSVFGTSSARASKYSGAASFSYISLGATSGFSTRVQLDWKWDKSRSGTSCGYNAYPPYAKIVYVN